MSLHAKKKEDHGKHPHVQLVVKVEDEYGGARLNPRGYTSGSLGFDDANIIGFYRDKELRFAAQWEPASSPQRVATCSRRSR